MNIRRLISKWLGFSFYERPPDWSLLEIRYTTLEEYAEKSNDINFINVNQYPRSVGSVNWEYGCDGRNRLLYKPLSPY